MTDLTLSRRRPLSYRNQPIDLLCKSMDWFLYDNGLRHESVNLERRFTPYTSCTENTEFDFVLMNIKFFIGIYILQVRIKTIPYFNVARKK